ncbi:M20/M25/M40 family metallo-hydrolase [Terrilactibacillus sp. S3-3]|nr:M20/M25/M40 family metallo-hydrolase [Terrilactibacillus sp. S3-3]
MPEVAEALLNLSQLPKIKSGLAFLKEDNEYTTKEQVRLTEIAAPPFKEDERGSWFEKRFIELGLTDVGRDQEGNVFGTKPGTGTRRKIVVSSHLDTVFPEETNVQAVKKDGIIYAPGISDDGRGLAILLTLIRALNHADVVPDADILFVATVGEEGLGDLRGVKALFKERDDIDGFISIEPGTASEIIYSAAGSRRYRIQFNGPGGHSFVAFGTPSAVHALGRAIAAISDIAVSEEPKTTFTVGTVSGGTSINTIAEDAEMVLDMRSSSPEALLALEKNGRLNASGRPSMRKMSAGAVRQPFGPTLFKWATARPDRSRPLPPLFRPQPRRGAQVLGLVPTLEGASSTDSNVPISLGIPAVTLGGGGESGGIHTLNESFNPAGAYEGPQRIFLTMLALSGLAGGPAPLVL